ncbi:MAG: M28 family metallopeptidase [Bacteroidota bacterium]
MKILSFFCIITSFYSCKYRNADAVSVPKQSISESSLKEHLLVLSSDDFQGRKPFTEGEARTVNYLKNQFKKYGLAPGNHGLYYQEVPMVELTAFPSDTLEISGERGYIDLLLGEDFVAYTERVDAEVTLENSEMVFVGYGIVAPEYGWDDYKDLDVSGKTVIVLVNDPGFASKDDSFFKGETMTYYGRWTYKYEEAARQGAAGCLIVHETVPAGYPWLVVRNSWSGASLYLDRDGDSFQPSILGWITREAAIQIFKTSGKDLKNFAAKSRRADFKSVALGLNATVSVKNKIRKDVSKNVIAMIKGKEKPEEYIVYSAHWDHLGIGPEIEGDTIYNGAHDNASGTATLLGIAEAMAKGPQPKRSMVFLAVTAEEQGLLGSKYYAENPVFPITSTLANINMDGITTFGPMKDLTVIGYGQSDLEDLAAEIAGDQNRYIIPDPDPGKGYFFRSDHFQFAKIGVPALYASGRSEHMTKGKVFHDSVEQVYLNTQYHRPQDEYQPWWTFDGMALDGELLMEVGYRVSDKEKWPAWKRGSEFKAVRQASLNP